MYIWLVVEQHLLRNAVSDPFRMLLSFINKFDRVLGIDRDNWSVCTLQACAITACSECAR